MVNDKTITCCKCNKVIKCSEEGYIRRGKKFDSEKDFLKNYVCKFCKAKENKK